MKTFFLSFLIGVVVLILVGVFFATALSIALYMNWNFFVVNSVMLVILLTFVIGNIIYTIVKDDKQEGE